MNGILVISIVLFAIVCLYSLIVGRYLIGWLKMPPFEVQSTNESTTASVVIAMRNEKDNILDCLNALAQQSYTAANFEIIISDDLSDDNSKDLVNEFINAHPKVNIQLIEYNKTQSLSGKKNALNGAIQLATGELILTVDADCTMGKDWLKTIVAYYQQGNYKMIVSPVTYHNAKGVLGKMQALEFSSLIGITAGALYHNEPLMCNGANLAFTKNAFNLVGGYSDNLNILSGDDVFLMIKIKNEFPGEVVFLKSKEAIVATEPAVSVSSFVQQRLRWASKTFNYSDNRIKFVSIITYLSNVSFIISLLITLFSDTFGVWLVAALGLKLLIDFTFLFFVTSFFEKRKLLWLFPIEELLYAIYVMLIGVYSQIGTYNWKDRY